MPWPSGPRRTTPACWAWPKATPCSSPTTASAAPWTFSSTPTAARCSPSSSSVSSVSSASTCPSCITTPPPSSCKGSSPAWTDQPAAPSRPPRRPAATPRTIAPTRRSPSTSSRRPPPAPPPAHTPDPRPARPQPVYILTVSHDGAVPVTCRLADGNTNDDPTHIPTWDTLGTLTGTPDFLYVADCKLASTDAMTHIDSHGGRFVTVLPRSRKEDTFFRTWITTHAPGWTEAIRLPGRRLDDPDRIYTVAPAPAPSKEGFRIIWVHSSGKHSNDADARQEKITRGLAAIDELSTRLAGPRCRSRDRVTAEQALAAVLAGAGTSRLISGTIVEITTETAKKSGQF